MNLFGAYIPDVLSEALGWTILHSLWQAMVIGLIALILMKSRKPTSPQFNYLVGTLSMLAVLASSMLTFLLEYHPDSGQVMASANASAGSLRDSLMHKATSGSSLALPDLFPLLTAIWMSGVFILSLRLAGGLALVNRLRKQEISPLPEPWKQRIDSIIRKSGIRRTVEFLLSGKVRIPTVIGVLRPLVLIPAGIISLMPVEQLEAVLAHEIAHIRRYDFLINIFQTLIEALFFYHPVVWILSRSVRLEREKCCDDYAVSICGKRSVYVRALAGLSEIQVRTAVPSVALSGNKNRIIIRVERLLKQQKMKTNASEKMVAGILILGSAIILTFSTGASPRPLQNNPGSSTQFNLQVFEKAPAMVKMEYEGEISEESALLAEPVSTRAIRKDDPKSEPSKETMDVKDNVVSRTFINKEGQEKTMKFTIRDGELKELYVNGEKIPESDYPAYKMEIDRTLEDLSDMENDLKNARQELNNLDFEKVQGEIQREMERFRKEDMINMQEELARFQEEQIDARIDYQALQKEVEKAMQEAMTDQEEIHKEIQQAQREAQKAMEEFNASAHTWGEKERLEMEKAIAEAMEQLEAIDMDEIMEKYEKEMLAIREIDYHKIQEEIESAMEKADLAGIEREMARAMQNMEKELIQMDQEKLHIARELKSMDELLEELEKLELKED